MKIVLITGAGSGFGLEAATRLAEVCSFHFRRELRSGFTSQALGRGALRQAES
jgi:NAD(P)-dependent dehydrogenase (short-subunit alcohol dehydrogenase family)